MFVRNSFQNEAVPSISFGDLLSSFLRIIKNLTSLENLNFYIMSKYVYRVKISFTLYISLFYKFACIFTCKFL